MKSQFDYSRNFSVAEHNSLSLTMKVPVESVLSHVITTDFPISTEIFCLF
jgi:hypothetical protein